MKKYLLPILIIGFLGCDSESISNTLDSQEPSELIIGTWRQDSWETYSGMLCSDTPSNIFTENYYLVITEDNFGTVNLDNCTITNYAYTWIDNGGNGYISSTGVNRNITTISDTEMTIEVSTSSSCYKYYLTKVTSVPGCPDL